MAAGENDRAGRDVRIRGDVGIRRVEDLNALLDEAEVDALHHRGLRHERCRAVVDGVNLIRDGDALLRTGRDRRRDQTVERIRAAFERLFQHIEGKESREAVRIARNRLTLRVKALLLGRKHADAVAGRDMRLRQMEERVLLREAERRREHQHMTAFRQRLQRGKAVVLIERKALCSRKLRLPLVMHKIALFHCIRQRIPYRVARRAEQHRTRVSGNAAFVKQAANKGGSHIVHFRSPFVP